MNGRVGYSCIVGTVVALCVAGSAAAQSLRPAAFEESIDPAEPVGGSVALGVVAVADGSSVDPAGITLKLLAPFTGKVLVKVSSGDARYTARAEYPVSATAPMSLRLDFPTRHAAVMRRYAIDQLAISATMVGDARNRQIPVSYGSAPAARSYVYVNSQNADVFVVDLALRQQRRCRRLTAIAGVKFDTVCDIATPTAGTRTIIRRLRGGVSVEPATIEF